MYIGVMWCQHSNYFLTAGHHAQSSSRSMTTLPTSTASAVAGLLAAGLSRVVRSRKMGGSSPTSRWMPSRRAALRPSLFMYRSAKRWPGLLEQPLGKSPSTKGLGNQACRMTEFSQVSTGASCSASAAAWRRRAAPLFSSRPRGGYVHFGLIPRDYLVVYI